MSAIPEWFRVTLASIGDAVIATDMHHRVQFLNSAAAVLTGWGAEEGLGEPLEEVFPLTDARGRLWSDPSLTATDDESPTAGGHGAWLAARDGARRPIDLTASPIRDQHGEVIGAVLVFRDISERYRTERRRGARQAVTQVLAEAASMAEATPRILQALCDCLQWPAAAIWIAEPGAGELRCLDFWHAPDLAVDEFEADTRNRRFASGIGLPGRVWQMAQPVWIPDVLHSDNFPRAPLAGSVGLHGAFGFPLILGPRVLGVIEFFSQEVREPDLDLLEMMGSIGGQIGQFMHRREAEQSLRDSEERLRLALEAGRMGIWDWNIRTGQIRWSDNLEPIHGLALGSFAGTFEAFLELVHPEDREMIQRAIERSLELRGGYEIEFRNVWPDGSVHWMLGKGRVFSDDRGEPLRMIGVGADISQRKQRELAFRFLAEASISLATLVDYESTLRSIAGSAVPFFADWCAVDMLESDGSLRRLAVTHVDPGKVALAEELDRRFPPELEGPLGAVNVLRTGQPQLEPEISDSMLQALARNPEHLAMLRSLGLRSLICVPLSSREGNLGFITFVTAESARAFSLSDLELAEELARRASTALENARLYEAVREADRRKDEFLAMLAHELRNPLAPIRNALHILGMPEANSGILAQARGMMERQIEQLIRLVDDLLDVSRIMRGKIELRKHPVELKEIVQRAVETSRPVIDAQRHEFQVSLPAEPVWLEADAIRLAQAVSNLLNNAAKYTEPGGRIWLEAERQGGRLELRVRDTGIGIEPDALAQVFELFVQAERGRNHAQGGLGIGLTLVRQLVELHGGTIEARSAGMAQGCEFVVRLPIMANAPESSPAPSSAANAEPGGNAARPRRILVVDDNVDAAKTLAMLLKFKKQDVQVVHDGPAALSLASSYRPDVVLLDIGMPGMDGYEVARRLRNYPELGNVLLVALTGWGQEEDQRRSRDAGFDVHLVKPIRLEMVERLLAHSKLPAARPG